ncbi:GTPase [Anaeromyxobacter oryzae]|uniref:GTPase n=1 Tax=Anaeromyxobacter oryzae TaxID=2918170 RepID=UPI0020BD5115|nr:GTPase [Anaeromyxobacter oryzae]
MPANLTAQYKDAELRLRQATSHDEKVEALREMLALLPKHKGTEKLHADLKKRLAKLEEEREHAARSGSHHVDLGHVRREGAGQWALVGPPNAGKSSLLAALTHAHPEIAEYPFTTHVPQPGMMPFEDVQVQLVDTPAIAPGHVEPFLPALVRGADGVVIVLDVAADDLEASLVGTLDVLLHGHVWPEGRPVPDGASPLVVPRPVLVAANKHDLDDAEGTFSQLAREAVGPGLPFFPVSATRGDGLDGLRPWLFRALRKIRVHTKEPGKKADLGKPFVLPEGAAVEALAALVHQDLAARLKFARVWGHARFDGQQVDRHHVLADGDVVELHA